MRNNKYRNKGIETKLETESFSEFVHLMMFRNSYTGKYLAGQLQISPSDFSKKLRTNSFLIFETQHLTRLLHKV